MQASRAGRAAVMCVLIVAACSPAAPPATSAPPSATAGVSLAGRITFMRYDADNLPEVWTACADLSGARQLTDVAGHGSGFSVWAPDGARIAFDSDREDPDLNDAQVINDIFTMASDGSDVRRLTGGSGAATDPAYSPDGTLIAFAADIGDPGRQAIYVANAVDGSNPRQVTPLPAGFTADVAPRFAPDGSRLVFTRQKNDSESTLYIVDLDGANLRALETPDLHPGDATWSPDGTRLVFEADNAQFPYGSAWVIGADGSGLTNLVPEHTASGAVDGFADPVWAPDGARIMLLHGLVRPTASPRGLATVAPDGSGLAYVGDGLGDEHQPDWIAGQC